MMLQVRLVHPLGDRLIDLPERSHEEPLVIGRATTADVQVPAPSVSRRHSLLYIHAGQWYIQDGNGGARTLVNGQPTPQPTAVNSGDVVTLGLDPSPPTLTIDPYGLMRRVDPQAEEQWEAPVVAYEAPAAPAPATPRYPTPVGMGARPGMPMGMPQMPPQMPPQIGAGAAFEAAETGDAGGADGGDDWMATAAAASNEQGGKRYYVPKPQGLSPGMISTAVFIGIAIVAIAGYWYHVRQNAEDERGKREQAKVDQEVQVVKTKNIFDDMEKEAKKKKLLAEIAAAATKPVVAAVEGTAAQDPGRQTEEWRRVEEAHTSFKPVEAIVVFGDYMKQFPTSPYAADVRKFTDEALDAIWWDRIVEIAQQRDDATKEIVARNRDMAQTQDPDFKKQLQEEKAVFEAKLQQANDALKAKNYLSESKPNLYDPAQMTELRRARNPVIYDEWKGRAEKRIKDSRGTKAVWD